MFNGQYILNGYNNDVDVWYNGASDLKVARSANLKEALTIDGMAYVKTEVPDMSFSTWQRHSLFC